MLQADFADFSVVCYVGLVYPLPHFGLLSRGEADRDEPAQYISMRAPETTVVIPNGSHYRDSQYITLHRCCSPSPFVHGVYTVHVPHKAFACIIMHNAVARDNDVCKYPVILGDGILTCVCRLKRT